MGDPESELIKAGAEALTEPAKQFLTKVAGTPGVELGEMMGERIRLRRWKAEVRMYEHACEYAVEHGIDPQEIPLKTLFPLLQNGSLEEDPDMADRWARLLANAAGDPDSVPPSIPKILAELSPEEASMLAEIGAAAETAGAPLFQTMVEVEHLPTFMAMESPLREAALGNLFRNALVTGREWPNHGEANSEPSDGPGSNRTSVRLTNIGFLLLVACGDVSAGPVSA